MLEVLGSLLLVGGSLGLLFWWQNRYWGPRKKQALMQQKPLLLLRDYGFEATDSAFGGELFGEAATVPTAYVGYVQGYAVEVSFGWEERPHFLVRVFFDPGSRDYDAIMHAWRANQLLARKWSAVEGVFCAPVYADAQLSYTFRPPGAEQLVALAEQLTELVRSLHQQPIAYAAGCKLATYVLASSKHRSQS